MKSALIRLFTINQTVAWQGVDDEEPERAEKGQEEKWRQHSSYLKLHPLKGVFADCAGAGAEEKGLADFVLELMLKGRKTPRLASWC